MIFLLGCLLPRFHELTHQRSNLICCGIERVMTAIDNVNLSAEHIPAASGSDFRYDGVDEPEISSHFLQI